MDRAEQTPKDYEATKQRTLNRGLIFAIFVALIGVALLAFGLTDNTEKVLSYSEAGSDVSYDVYLLENKSYNEKYLNGSSELSYPTSLIDFFKLNFKYNVVFNEPVKGELHYKLVALTSADKVDGATTARLWSEEKELVPEKTTSIDGTSISLSQSTNINYSRYVDMIKRFESEAQGVAAKGNLNVALVITGELQPESFSHQTAFDSRVDFTVPIASNSSVEAKTSTKNGTEATLKENPEEVDRFHVVCTLCGAILLLLAFGIVVIWLIARRVNSRKHPYEAKVKHLLNTYDAVIAEVSQAPSIGKNALSEVSDFDELLDVYNSVHLPINFYQNKDTSFFVINGEKNTWRYVLKKSDFERHVDKEASR